MMASKVGSNVLLPVELTHAIRSVFNPLGLAFANATREPESADYGACRFTLANRQVAFRVARTTPSKIGQFVTLWKRPGLGAPIAPLDTSDGIAFVVVAAIDGGHGGHFVFDASVLVARGVMSEAGRGGKRAIRVYPPWSRPTSAEAVRSQRWQSQCFLSFAVDQVIDTALARKLYGVPPD
jgi:hypothetical protein